MNGYHSIKGRTAVALLQLREYPGAIKRISNSFQIKIQQVAYIF